MAHSQIKDESVNLRCLIFIFLLLTHGVSGALEDTREELRHNLYRHQHGSEMEEKEERFPFSNSNKHRMENKSRYGDLFSSILAIPHTPRPSEGYGCQQINKKGWCFITVNFVINYILGAISIKSTRETDWYMSIFVIFPQT